MASDLIGQITQGTTLVGQITQGTTLVGNISSLHGGVTAGELAAELAEKASVEDVALKADKAYVDSQDALKADKTYVDTKLSEKANKQQEAWITPTLLNGWVEADSSRSPKYMKDQFGIVHIKGCVKSGLKANTVFFLPTGYRPENTFNSFAVISDGLLGNCLVQSGGAVQAAGCTNISFYLDGISFKGV